MKLKNKKYLFYCLSLFLLCVASSSAVFIFLKNWEHDKIILSLEQDFDDRVKVIKKNIDLIPFSLNVIRNFFAGSEFVSRKEFEQFVRPVFSEINGIQALEWIPRVKNHEKNYYIQRARREGLVDFRITEIAQDGGLVPVKKRKEYFPVYYMEPLKGNEKALGFDLASNPTRLQALKKSIAEKGIVVSDRINLVQEKEKEYGVLFFLPVFESSIKTGSDKENSRGFVLGVVRPKTLIEKSISYLQPKGIDIILMDESPAGNKLLYYHGSRIAERARYKMENVIRGKINVLHRSIQLKVANRNWKLVCIPNNFYLKNVRTVLPLTITLLNVLVFLLIFVILFKSLNEKERIQGLVDLRTHELKLSEERLELALKGADLGLWDWNVESGDVFFNERWAEMLGFELHEIKPNVESWELLLNPDDRDLVMEALTEHLEGRSSIYRTEHRLKTKSGDWKWVLDTGKVFARDEEGNPLRAIGIHMDIDDAKNYQSRLKEISITDSLTGLANRRYFFKRTNEELEKFSRGLMESLSLAILDIDHFKRINDTFGHQAGDYVLRHFSGILQKFTRKYDLVGRYGGEEFVILFLNSDKTVALSVCEKLKNQLSINTAVFEGTEIPYSFSGGIVGAGEVDAEECDVSEIIKIADQRLYRAKETGRDKILTE